MQSFLSQVMEAAEESELHPVQEYPNMEHAQYDNSQYGFAHDPNFPIDHNLEMSVNYVSNNGKNQNEGPSRSHMSLSGQNGHGGVMRSHQGSTNTSGSLTTTTQPQTPLTVSTKRKSLEDTTDNTPAGGDSRRKRSKVSRACDQCRRKKVRCDADSGDGNLKTCTNCVKQGQTCDYNRIPQKRGPSKGYIKDLSERVHHLEDSLANAGNYRSSLDAGTYVDAPFSPDEDPSQRRPASISQQRSPFADFTRDRFPSIGGWNSNSQITTQPRDRGSIAIPPDQIAPTTQPTSAKSSKPRWITQSVVLSEKTKTPAETEETAKLIEGTKMDSYYEHVHPKCTILPEKEKTLEILLKASDPYVLAFSGAMRLLPQKKKDDSSLPAKSREELEVFIHEQNQIKWAERSNIDSLVLLWTTVLLHIIYLHDMRLYAKQDVLIKAELDLIDRFTKTQDFMIDPYEYEWLQTFHIAVVFARLNALSHGNSAEPLPLNLTSYLNQDWHIINPRSRYTVVQTESIQAGFVRLPKGDVKFALANAGNQQANARLQDALLRAWLIPTGVSPEEPWVLELAAFMSLLSVQIVTPGAPSGFIANVVDLVNTIRVTSLQQKEEQYLFNPLSFHAVTLATVALIELQSCHLDQQYSQGMVDAATTEMVKQLKEFVKRRTELDGGAEGIFWAKTLLELVEEHAHPLDGKREEDAAPGLVWILQRGYLEPLLMKISK